jgi:membrane protein YqaA with SNARE-associated domain
MHTWTKFRHWIELTLPALGAGGIFLAAFLDSSFVSLPVINDVLVIELSVLHPARMPVYAAAAVLGSLAGCLVLFYLARKSGAIYFERHAGGRAARIHEWLDRNAFLTVAVTSILPPPMPFKLFVIGAGVFQVGVRPFSLALIAGRGFRYFALGLLAVRYGAAAGSAIAEHKLEFAAAALAFVLASYLLTRAAFREQPPGRTPSDDR